MGRILMFGVLAVAAVRCPAAAPVEVDGFLRLGFDQLSSFKFVTPAYDPETDAKKTPPTGDEQIPSAVKSWEGHRAIITGYMLPTKLENGKAVEFLIMANQMACCYGAVPNMNDWVIVRMPKGVPAVQDIPLSFYGTFHVGARYENGYMTGIYEMDAERQGETKD